MALYTPFFERAAGQLGASYGQKRTGELAKNAFMGDRQAMAELARIDPNLAQQMETQRMQQEQINLQKQSMQATSDQAKQEWIQKNQGIVTDLLKAASAMPFPEAVGFLDMETKRLGVNQMFNPQQLTPEAFAQIQQAYGPKESTAGFTLAPGAARYDAAGNVVAERAPSESAGNAREQTIQDYMQTLGMDRPSAIARVDAQYTTDPVSGNLIAIDRAKGTATLPPIAMEQAQAPRPNLPAVTEEDLAFDPAAGTGMGASFLSLWNSTAGQLPLTPIFQGTEVAAQQLRILERDAINALATSSRPAVVEQERILGAIPKSLDWSQNPEVARWQMTSFINLMTNQYVDDLRYSQSVNNPKTLREEAGRRAGEVERVINRVLTPEAAKTMFDTIRNNESEIKDLVSVPIADLQAMDPEGLTDAQLDVYIERLKSGR